MTYTWTGGKPSTSCVASQVAGPIRPKLHRLYSLPEGVRMKFHRLSGRPCGYCLWTARALPAMLVARRTASSAAVFMWRRRLSLRGTGKRGEGGYRQGMARPVTADKAFGQGNPHRLFPDGALFCSRNGPYRRTIFLTAIRKDDARRPIPAGDRQPDVLTFLHVSDGA